MSIFRERLASFRLSVKGAVSIKQAEQVVFGPEDKSGPATIMTRRQGRSSASNRKTCLRMSFPWMIISPASADARGLFHRNLEDKMNRDTFEYRTIE